MSICVCVCVRMSNRLDHVLFMCAIDQFDVSVQFSLCVILLRYSFWGASLTWNALYPKNLLAQIVPFMCAAHEFTDICRLRCTIVRIAYNLSIIPRTNPRIVTLNGCVRESKHMQLAVQRNAPHHIRTHAIRQQQKAKAQKHKQQCWKAKTFAASNKADKGRINRHTFPSTQVHVTHFFCCCFVLPNNHSKYNLQSSKVYFTMIKTTIFI